MTRDELIVKIANTAFIDMHDAIVAIQTITEAGYAIVPVEPTQDMEDAALQEMNDTLKRTSGYSFNPIENYKAMIEAGRVK